MNLSIFTYMFSSGMTNSTQRNKISFAVCDPIICQSIKPKWVNMVNIQCSSKLRFLLSAVTAGMVIPLSCLSGLSIPIWTVIICLATSPTWIVISCPVLRLPFSKTFTITKGCCILASKPRRSFQLIATVLAKLRNGLFSSWRNTALKSIRHTLPRTVLSMYATQSICWRTIKRFFTPRTMNITAFSGVIGTIRHE